MDAEEVIARKQRDPDGFIIEIVVWRVPTRIPGSAHFYKYRLFFGRPGERLVGFDNEGGKGDHKHVAGIETGYEFAGINRLLRDFAAEVNRWKAK